MSKLTGKVAIISDSGRGIGSALAVRLAADGASIVVNDLDTGARGCPKHVSMSVYWRATI